MARTAADVMVETLAEWGVEVVFGLPGDGINGLMEALRTHRDRIRFVQVRHEETAAFAACGYAKFTGKLGVCLATSGPGGLHLLNGLYDAKMDGQPVLAITGAQFHDLMHTYGQQDVQLDYAYQDVAIYNSRVMGPGHVETITDLACRHALGWRGVSHITFPTDLQGMSMEKKTLSMHNRGPHTAALHASKAGVPSSNDIAAAVDVLNAGADVAILAGRGALGATEELEAVAERLGAPIIKALLGKAVVPDDSPYTTGGLGLLGTRPSQNVMRSCDTLLMVGTSFPYMEYLPEPGQARGVQIDIDPARIGLRYPVEVGLVADSRLALLEMLPHLARKEDRSFLAHAQDDMADWWKVMAGRAAREATPVKPQTVAWELGERLATDAIVAADSGTNTTVWSRQIRVKRGQMHSVSGLMASMACALPYAIAAQIAYPERQCVAIAGDGGFSMLMADFVTCVKYDLPIKVVIIKNNTLGQIKWEQIAFEGNPQFGVELAPIDFAAFARACGASGFTIKASQDCGGILDTALATPGPVIVQAVVDPDEPLLPPMVTAEQVSNFVQALLKGQPHPLDVALTATSEKVREMI